MGSSPFSFYKETKGTFLKSWQSKRIMFRFTKTIDWLGFKNQALVLVNYGDATGAQIWELALKIQEKVRTDFGILIEPEVNVF